MLRLRVTDFFFNENITEEYESWMPDDPAYVDEWVKVLVGIKEGEGHWFQIHICTFKSMVYSKNKEFIFAIPYWESIENLIAQLDKFILDTLPDNLDLNQDSDYGIAMENLSKYWLWEYERYT